MRRNDIFSADENKGSPVPGEVTIYKFMKMIILGIGLFEFRWRYPQIHSFLDTFLESFSFWRPLGQYRLSLFHDMGHITKYMRTAAFLTTRSHFQIFIDFHGIAHVFPPTSHRIYN